MKLIIVTLLLFSANAKADLDQLVLDSNNNLRQVPAPQTQYNHPVINYYNSDGSSSTYQGNMIYHSDHTSTMIQTEDGPRDINDLYPGPR